MNRKLSILIFLCVAAVTFEVVMLTVGAKKQSVEPALIGGNETPNASQTSPVEPDHTDGNEKPNSSQTSPIVPTTADLQPDDTPQSQSSPTQSHSSQPMSATQPVLPRAAESTPLIDDSVLLQARRELRQAQTEVSIPPADAVTSPDGRIHLKSGGTISAEEWQAARRHIP